MRLIPKTLLVRTSWVLGFGFFFMLVDGFWASWLLSKLGDDDQSLFEIAHHIKIISIIVNNTEPNDRQRLIKAIDDKALLIRWNNEAQFSASVADWGTHNMEDHIKEFINDPGILNVHVRHPLEPSSKELDRGRFITLVQLQDQTWLEFKTTEAHQHYRWGFTVLAVLGCFIAGIYILAILVTRQVIKPLKEFSMAATRFSTDLDAPPLIEQGPLEIRTSLRAFNAMQDRIRSFVQERMQMIAAISHDLRTPLTRLQLRTEHIQDATQKQKALRDIQDMRDMLKATLEFARDDATDEETTPVDLAALVQSVCDDYSDNAANIMCDCPNHLYYLCKPIAIRRVLTNLIDNALNYGGEARVMLSSQGNTITIEISDHGPGIPDHEKENVFTPFYRVEKSRNRDTGGTGLGLTVARTIIRAHGGQLLILDNPGGGLIVSIALPVQT